MANPGQDRPFESTTEQTGKITEETTRATRNVADFSERAARTNLDVFQSGMETARHVWQSSAELSSSLTRRTTDEFGRVLGLAGGGTDETAQQASRNISAIAQTSHTLNDGVRKISDEWFKFARTRIERAFEHFDKAARARTPQELVAVQTEAVRDTLESMMQATQRISHVAQQTADVATRKLSETARQVA